MTKFLLVFATILFCTSNVFAQTSADLKRKQAEIQKDIDALRKSLDETKKYKKQGLAQYNLVQQKIRLREAQIANVNQQINLIQGDINESNREIVKLKHELDTLKVQYEKSVVYAYKNRSNYDFLNFIFSAVNFNDAVKRVAYLRSYRNYREEQAGTITRTQQQLQGKIASLNENKQRKNVALQEQSKQVEVLEEDKKEKQEVVSKLKSREKELMADMAAKRKQDITLKNAITAAIKKEIAKERERQRLADAEAARREADVVKTTTNNTAAAPTKTSTKPLRTLALDDRPETKALSESFEKNQNSLPWPVAEHAIAMHFGRNKYGEGPLIIDNPSLTIETNANSSVKAVFDGEVSSVFSVGDVQGVILKHGKYFTTYSNLGSVSVSKGQQVKMGTVLGRVAEKDEGRGELEFLITDDKNRNLDPEKWLR